MHNRLDLAPLQSIFGDRVKTDVLLARYTAARIGGLADALLAVNNTDELAQAAISLWETGTPFLVLGGGSNVLVSDRGVRAVVLLNRARNIRFNLADQPPTVCAESGANTGVVARQAATKGLSGFEWAAGIPGTIGGAVIGNAGAHDGDMANNLIMAEILQHDRTREVWSADRLAFSYRSSSLKSQSGTTIVLSARLRLAHRPQAEVQAKMDRFLEHRRRTQPPGASMGSMFKNPPGDYAGRLIDAAGLKGHSVGGAEISPLHGNFFLNHGDATAKDIYQLIKQAQKTVYERFGILLELEIERIGEWEVDA
jgi:UDP-N-acetylmuramate dehydrogenase